MKGDEKVIEYLNQVLKNELTAVNLYFLHSRKLKSWGVHKLAAMEYKESIDEMIHADQLIERLLFYDARVNMLPADDMPVGNDVLTILEGDLELEMQALPVLREAIAHCEKVSDFVSREIFQEILDAEEEHIDFLETQLGLIKSMGLENYIQINSEPAKE